MTADWLPDTILRAASLLAPDSQRAEWLKGWRSELWYISRNRARFCLGAFRDAIWLRQNSERLPRRTAFWFDSPLSCLAFLALAAAVSIPIVVCLPAPNTMARPHLNLRDVAVCSFTMLLLTILTFPATRLALGASGPGHPAAPWLNRLRRGIFLLLKLVLVQPVMLLGFLAMIWTGPVIPFVPQLADGALWFLTFRWVLLDQQNRCPVCLRLLTDPVRVGAPSQTFLEWYGSELVCSRGHGLLQIAAVPASYSAASEWHRLDDSWSSLFTPVEVRQR